YQADTFLIRTVAIPLFGSPATGVSEEIALDALFLALVRSLHKGITAVREVRIVLAPRGNVPIVPLSPVSWSEAAEEVWQPARTIVRDIVSHYMVAERDKIVERFLGGRVVVVTGGITRQAVDAIVNATDGTLLGEGGVDGAIHRVAGPLLKLQCGQLRQTTL